MRRCHACSSSAPVLAVECSFVSGWDAGLQAVGDRNLAGGSMSRPRFLTVKSSSAEFIRPCCGQAYYGCHCHYFGPTVVGIGITPSVIFFGMVQSQEPDAATNLQRFASSSNFLLHPTQKRLAVQPSRLSQKGLLKADWTISRSLPQRPACFLLLSERFGTGLRKSLTARMRYDSMTHVTPGA